MTLLAPLALGLGLVAAVVVIGLHLITTRRPPPAPLPTARFVPVTEARAVSRASRPTDLLLLALRLLAVVLIGAAFARPVLDAVGPRVRSVVLLDVSGSVADPAAARAAAVAGLTAGGALILFDTAAREVSPDSLRRSGVVVRAARGALSPALVAARAAAVRIARGADSVRLVLVSPITTHAMDAATVALRGAWPGGIELVRVAAAPDTAAAALPSLVTPLDDDPLLPALARLPRARGAHEVRIVRERASAADSAWVRRDGSVLVIWPLASEAAVTADGVVTSAPEVVTLVAPLGRMTVPADGAVLARWRDGAPAVVQHALGGGCVRQVGIGVPVAGDLTLRAPFGRLLARVVEPCGGRRAPAAADSTLDWLRGEGGAADADQLAVMTTESPLAAWLLAAALLALTAEWLLRRRGDA